MRSDHLHRIVPLDRFRELVGALGVEREAWEDAEWLRLAAQAAVLCPEPAERLAAAIRRTASGLRSRAPWYSALAGPRRFVLAALLVASGRSAVAFAGDHARIGEWAGHVGLPIDDGRLAFAVIILRLQCGRRGVSLVDVERVKAIHERMKRFHWWLTGADDLPACAALAGQPGSAFELGNRIENIYQRLRAGGLAEGDHLQTAANLLPLSGLHGDEAAARYLALRDACARRADPVFHEDYDALAVLALLDHDPDLVAQRVHAVRSELALSQPGLEGAALGMIAADLVVLDLVRFGRDLAPATDAKEAKAMLARVQTVQIASAVVASGYQPPVQLPSSGFEPGWPY